MKYLSLLVLSLLLISCSTDSTITLSSDEFTLEINSGGVVQGMADKSGTNYVADGENQPLLQLRKDSTFLLPTAARREGEVLHLSYAGHEVEISVVEKPTHVRFEIISVEPNDIDVAVWGPYHTSIDSLIGETVGVVRDPGFSVGIQSLNEKTLGGFPWQENDAMPQMDAFESGDYTDLSEKGKRYVLYRVEAARPMEFGSALQAYSRNRFEDRVIENWNHDHYEAPAFEDGGVIGSAIALFGSPTTKVLENIGEIEVAEDLPHPTIDGVWSKMNRQSASAYLIIGFGEEDAQRAIDYTKQAGLKYLYHPGPFETWGKFILNETSFPKGVDGLKEVVDLAESQGVYVGAHTLSNFITPNDPYVTPVPDPRLAKVGSSELTSDIDSQSTTIEVGEGMFFDQFRNNNMRTIQIGEELIRYGKVNGNTLEDCQRGQFGTTASDHASGEVVSKLADHGYKVFLSNTDLTIEMSESLAELYNATGLRQISFDGLEGNRSTGMGNYGETLMPTTWYNGLKPELKQHYIADASRTTHYFWHIFSRMNWGEPWYAGFRESQTEYRMKNQKYFQRNMIPGMLGWFLLRPTTSIEDTEWMLAKSAAYNAGYSFVCNYDALEGNGQTNKILDLLGQYEALRMADAFSPSQQLAMQDVTKEFHLEYRSQEDWALYEYHLERATHSSRQKQPGEPTWKEVAFENPFDSQSLQFIISAPEESGARNISFEIDNYKEVKFDVSLSAGHHLRYTGGSSATIYDTNWNEVSEVTIDAEALSLDTGAHTLKLDNDFDPGDGHEIKFEFKVAKLLE